MQTPLVILTSRAVQCPSMGALHGLLQGPGKCSAASRLSQGLKSCNRIKVHFKDPKGNLLKTIEANEGDDLLSLAHEHDIDLEGA